MKNKREIIESKYPPRNNEDIWLKDLLLYASTTKGWLPLGSEKTYSNKTELLKDTPTGGTIGIDKETGIAYLYNDVSKEWTPIGGGGGGVTETTWQELKDKRDAGELTPGSLYRITDYNCTTTQENTQSAGHQFDIVLLALSADKLAEEGWAMMHDNIYDVTFADGVTKKCYLYYTGEEDAEYNIVDVTTLMGTGYVPAAMLTINEETKTAIYSENSDNLSEEDVLGNYFQNSNLSAWKVWYCLDNDKSRFGWADDSVDENVPKEFITVDGFDVGNFYRATNHDSTVRYSGEEIILYAWCQEDGEDWREFTVYTLNEIPIIGDDIFDYERNIIEDDILVSYTPAHEGTNLPNGRGVVYRMIDEWNNDVGYDFKNIQFVRKLTDGEYDPDNGEDTWCYTFNGWDGDNSACVDATTDITLEFKDTDNNIHFIKSLGDNVFLEECCDIKIMDTGSGLITLSSCLSTTLIATYIFELASENGAIYIGNKKVLTEE